MTQGLRETRITFASGDLTLVGALHEGDGNLGALVLHPHPLYGGDMRNHVVGALCETLAGAGATTLRFDFRGAGESDGSFDNGRGERDDVLAAGEYLRGVSQAPLVLAGYSFGAMMAYAAAPTLGPAALILVSPPPAGQPSNETYGGPTLAITGEQDAIAPPRVLEEIAAETRAVVPGVDHGWWPGLNELQQAVAAFVGAQFPASAG
jgi:alpha/beta superfamily hydrolase